MRKTTTQYQRICFVGAGAMASAIVGGILRNKLVAPENISLIAPRDCTREKAQRKFRGVVTSPVASSVLPTADIAVLAVKPQVAPGIMRAIKPHLHPRGALVLSVMAGFTVADLEAALDGNKKHRIIRTMPNTNLLAGHGCVGYSTASNVTPEDEAVVNKIFGSLGFCAKVTEMQLLGVTGLAGSGPAYVATFIEALSDAGVKNGLPRELANKYAFHTVFGTAKLLLESDLSTLQVKEMVCSPGGTTIAGIEALEKNGLRYATMSAVNASAEKSLMMSKSGT
ncbi:delta-1-pyrroline-5-carboxylate reductase, putative [Bodo saltans]|uniref:Delta-1-pyrroline-5-carboxylate reductase, putative n=1 Tax=Bodo saltans TaxID=75058 RepID=A0A0S4JNV8_BODSA|nr:delta-1-pyrroline-5-carboxylate reductase, putative [Bodo saltans]|eukprot:CUG92125.1 delta-1-pyrroline-5-carboxylate reductase, putative [Bodo saltans]